MFALFKESDRSYKLLGMKVGKVVKNCKKHGENKDFLSKSLVFEIYLLESQANNLHCSFLNSNESDLIMVALL